MKPCDKLCFGQTPSGRSRKPGNTQFGRSFPTVPKELGLLCSRPGPLCLGTGPRTLAHEFLGSGNGAVVVVQQASRSMRGSRDPSNLDLPCVESSMKNRTIDGCSPCRVHISTVKKSVATISSQGRAQKLLPCRLPAPLRCRARCRVAPESARSCCGQLVPQIRQCTLDSPIAPIPVLFRHAHEYLKPRALRRCAVVPVHDGPFHRTSGRSVSDATPTKSLA
jgi:hypothetical protein